MDEHRIDAASQPQPPTGRRQHRMRARLLVLGVVVLLGVFVTGLGVGVVADQVLMHPTPATAVESPPPVPPAFQEVWNLVHEHYVQPSKINDPAMVTGAINGMLDTLGDQGHTRYLTPGEVQQHDESLSGSYVGVGIQVEQQGDNVVVVAPIADSPAQRAGVRAGDVLVSVNGQSVTGMPIDRVVTLVRGPEGSTVDLVFQRPGQDQPLAFTLTRAKLQVSAVNWVMLPNKVADIHLTQFSSGASAQLAAAIKAAEEAGATGIIFDLRNNPGGLVDEAIGVASQFLPPDTPVFISQVRDGQQTVHRTKADVRRTDLPVVVLVDKGTASASEIVSGALQQDHRAKLVGEATFGTGTVLSQYNLSDGSALLLGTELWLTPNGQLIKGNGIKPDFAVALPQDVTPYLPIGDPTTPEAIQARQKDVQLQGGLKLLAGQPVASGTPTPATPTPTAAP